MSSLKRFGIGLPAAAAVTLIIGGVMAGLMRSDDLDLGEKTDAAQFEINPVVDEVAEIERQERIEKFDPIETPPPLPTPVYADAGAPDVPSVRLSTGGPDFDDFRLKIVPMTYTLAPRDEQPIVRMPPNMPPRAERSGHCTVSLSIDSAGKPFDITTPYCTDRVFSRATIRAVERWLYNPAIEDGAPVTRRGLTNKVIFRLKDERGNIIPE